MSKEKPRHLVIVGDGEENIEAIRRLANQSREFDVTFINNSERSPVGEMIPGYLMGHFRKSEIHRDIRALCHRKKVRFLTDHIESLDLKSKTLSLKLRGDLKFDCLSICYQGRSKLRFEKDDKRMITMAPFSGFLSRWRTFLKSIEDWSQTSPPRVAIVADDLSQASFLFAINSKLKNKFPDSAVDFIHSPGEGARSADRKLQDGLIEKMEKVGIHYSGSEKVDAYKKGVVTFADRTTRNFDFVFWAVSDDSPEWLQNSTLKRDAQGFLKVDRFLRSESSASVLIAGSLSRIKDKQFRGGVYRESQAMVLSENMRRLAEGRSSLTAYRSKLRNGFVIRLGEKHSMYVYKGWLFANALVSKWDQKRLRKKTLLDLPLGPDTGKKNLRLDDRLSADFECQISEVNKQEKKLTVSLSSALSEVKLKSTHAIKLGEVKVPLINGDPYSSVLWGFSQLSNQLAFRGLSVGEVHVQVEGFSQLSLFDAQSLSRVSLALHRDHEVDTVQFQTNYFGEPHVQVKVFSNKKSSDSIAKAKAGEALILTSRLGLWSLQELRSGKEASEGFVCQSAAIDSRLLRWVRSEESGVREVMSLFHQSALNVFSSLAQSACCNVQVHLANIETRRIKHKPLEAEFASDVVSVFKARKKAKWRDVWAEINSKQSPEVVLLRVKNPEKVLEQLHVFGVTQARHVATLVASSEAKVIWEQK